MMRGTENNFTTDYKDTYTALSAGKTAVAENSLSLQRCFSFGESRYRKCTCRQVSGKSGKFHTKLKSRHEYFEGGSDPAANDKQNSAIAERMYL